MVSILVSAYKADDYLKELLDSIDYDNCEVLICSDNCFDTFVELKHIRRHYPFLRVFDSNVNRGPYATINALAKFAKGDFIIPFGADDYFLPGALEKIADYNPMVKDVRFRYINFKSNKYRKEMECIADGVMRMDRDFFIELGGFHDWRCGADTALKLRSKERTSQHKIDEALFMRRLHDNSLTRSKATGVGSKARTDATKWILDKKYKQPIITYEEAKIKEI